MNLEQAIEKGIKILDEPPGGWRELRGALTAPSGYVWYSNGKSLFGGEYEDALVKIRRWEGRK